MEKYKFKYWFEWGCSKDRCPCLWSDNDAARGRFGYSVDLNALPISQELISFLFNIGMEHDKALDWDYPSNPLLWSPEEEQSFLKRANEGYLRLQQELGSNYEIEFCI